MTSMSAPSSSIVNITSTLIFLRLAQVPRADNGVSGHKRVIQEAHPRTAPCRGDDVMRRLNRFTSPPPRCDGAVRPSECNTGTDNPIELHLRISVQGCRETGAGTLPRDSVSSMPCHPPPGTARARVPFTVRSAHGHRRGHPTDDDDAQSTDQHPGTAGGKA
jgi:hypothetical protein